MSDEIQRVTQRKARKRHQCQLCGNDILPGCEYVHEAGKYEGRFYEFHRHIHCDAMLDAYNGNYNQEYEYTVDEVTSTLWLETCRILCGEEQRDECDPSDLYSCELCQRKLLHNTVLDAAIKSVRDNYDWDRE